MSSLESFQEIGKHIELSFKPSGLAVTRMENHSTWKIGCRDAEMFRLWTLGFALKQVGFNWGKLHLMCWQAKSSGLCSNVCMLYV